jgi:hypothetical protein
MIGGLTLPRYEFHKMLGDIVVVNRSRGSKWSSKVEGNMSRDCVIATRIKRGWPCFRFKGALQSIDVA